MPAETSLGPGGALTAESPRSAVPVRLFLRRHAALIGVVTAIGLELIIFGYANRRFLSIANGAIILRQIAAEGIVAIGATAIMISGSIDLSFGAVVGLAGSVVGVLVGSLQVPVWMGVAAALLTGMFVGAVNGIATQGLRIPAFISTLATLFVAQGISLQITGGYAIPITSQVFAEVGQGYLWIVPLPVVYLAAAMAIGYFWLNMTVSGSHVYAVGSSESAALRSGVPVSRLRLGLFVLEGSAAAISGIILASRLSAATPTTGDDWLLDVLAAVIIGGTSLFGGKGSLLGTLLGLIFIGMLANGMILMGISPNIQLIIKGLFVLGAVWFQVKAQ